MQKYVNGVLTDMTSDEIAARQAEEAAWAAGANDRAAAEVRQERNSLIADDWIEIFCIILNTYWNSR